MENANLDFGKIILRVLVLIIVKPFVLPIQIYMNTLRNLSSHDDENSNESLLDGELHSGESSEIVPRSTPV